MEIVSNVRLKGDQFYPQARDKNQIYLHHTAGLNAKGAINWWNQTPENVGTAYVIERDGTIYEVFDPKAWAFHLGVKGDSNIAETDSIGIEIVAGGHLNRLKNGKLAFMPLYPKEIGAKEIPGNEIIELQEEWRGYKFYHKYTDAQIESVVGLISHLVKEFGISIQKDLKDFFEYSPEGPLSGKPGLYSHTTVRKDKDDIYPDPELLKAIYSAFLK